MSGRGAQRREQLVRAAADLLGREGPAALSARAVAGEAGVPLAAVTYYFDSVDDLVRAGAERLYEGYLEAARTLAVEGTGTDPRACAGRLVLLWLDPLPGGPEPRRVRHLLTSLAAAAEQPALAPQLRRYDESLADLARDVLRRHGRDASRARLLLAALDGLALARLSGLDVGATRQEPQVLTPERLLADLTDDLLLVLDDLAPTAPA